MRRVLAALIIIGTACGKGAATARTRDDLKARDLVGAWDATMRVERPYPLQFRPPELSEICGTIALVENREDKAAGGDLKAATQLGVYDLPLSRIGLEWKGVTDFPAAAVTTAITPPRGSAAMSTDSVRFVLNPGSDERIVLSGLYEAARISGTWSAQSSRGTAAGSFSMRPHVGSGAAAEKC